MIRKTALLASLAGAFVFAAPALAQDATEAPAPAEQSAQPDSLTLTPGAKVKSKDGTELGELVGVINGASGQELAVRGADSQVRPVPVTGIAMAGADVMVDATLADYQAATPVAQGGAATDPNAPTPTDTPDAEPTSPDEDPDAANSDVPN